MLNLRSPRVAARKLYITMVHSIGLYGAPVWAESVAGFRLADAACVLSGTLPLDLLA